jgi:hypothetical protein
MIDSFVDPHPQTTDCSVGATVTGEFGSGEQFYMIVPQGFEKYYCHIQKLCITVGMEWNGKEE